MHKNTNPYTPLDSIIVPLEYWGLPAISKRMSWKYHQKVKDMAKRYHFPLLRLPVRSARHWTYYTNEQLILAWYAGMIQNTRRYLLEGKQRGTNVERESEFFNAERDMLLGIETSGTRALREKALVTNVSVQATDIIDNTCTTEGYSEQASLAATSASAPAASTIVNDINELASK